MRIVFMGSSTFGLPALKLLHQKHQVVCVYTRPAKPAGRGMQEQKTPIHEFALTKAIQVKTPPTLRTETAAAELIELQPDVVVVAAYGLILPQAILDIPKHGCINIHGSLLPRWRGAAPIHHALLNGDPEIGVTIMKMDVGLDTGPMLKKGVVQGHTFTETHDVMAELGGVLLIDVLDHLDTITPEIQDESLATYAHKVTKVDATITPNMPVQNVLNIIHTFGGNFGGRFTYKGETLAIHTATNCTMPDQPDDASLIKDDKGRLLFVCSDGMIEIQSIQRSGKRIMTTKDFLNGFKL
ncbi:MAG: methionyl-tRNA formyltransferase [Pseudomonadota bacterium]